MFSSWILFTQSNLKVFQEIHDNIFSRITHSQFECNMTFSTIFQLVSHFPPPTVKIYVCFLLRMLWFLPCRKKINLNPNLKSWKTQMENKLKVPCVLRTSCCIKFENVLAFSQFSMCLLGLFWKMYGAKVFFWNGELGCYIDVSFYTWLYLDIRCYLYIYIYLLFAGLKYIRLHYPCIDIVVGY